MMAMPNHEEHCLHSLEHVGVRGDDIHSWMDERSVVLGPTHRRERHDVNSIPIAVQMFGEKYGDEIVRKIFLDHLYLDSKENHKAEPLSSEGDLVEGTFGLIALGGIVGIFVFLAYWLNLIIGNPIGLWWSQNCYNVIGATASTIVLVIITFYVFTRWKHSNHPKAGEKPVALLLSFGLASLIVFFLFGLCAGEGSVFVLQNWYFFVIFSFVCFAIAFLLRK